jgi:Mg2+ and Co2+ transporter CorA
MAYRVACFLPLTVLTGMLGMNVKLPSLPGGESSQFWPVVLRITRREIEKNFQRI